MLTGKERSYLRGLANTLSPLFHVGKSGVTPELTAAVDEALEARELVKLAILDNCDDEPKNVADTLAGRCRSEVVQVIGRRFILYRRSKKKQVIELPKK